MAYETQIPDAWREMRCREQAEARQVRREAVHKERQRTAQLTQALRIAGKILVVVGAILIGIVVLGAALAGAPPSRRRR